MTVNLCLGILYAWSIWKVNLLAPKGVELTGLRKEHQALLDLVCKLEVEPLPKTSPLWGHPKVFVTPHTAATSDPVHLAPIMLRQMDTFERGESLQNLVDRKAGY